MEPCGGSSAPSPKTTLGCIGKCTSGLTLQELDLITDHVHKTVAHPQGRKIFRRFLGDARRELDLAALGLYERCCEYIEKDHVYRMSEAQPTTSQLEEDVDAALTSLEELDGIREIDLALLERYSQSLSDQSRESMLDVLEETKTRLLRHLGQAHKGFRAYAKQPCPKTR